MAFGRPPKYSKDMVKALEAYIVGIEAKGDIPFKEQFCYNNAINSGTYSEWVNTHKDFSETNKKLEDLQKFKLMKGGLINEYNTASSIFQLKANHGLMETEKRIFDGDLNLKHSDMDDEQLDKAIESKVKKTK